jgi:hypothetical protein
MPVTPITELPAAEVFKTHVQDFGITRDGRATRNPWQYDALPDEIAKAPVQFYIYNVGPLTQIINAGSMGQHFLFPPKEGEKWGKPIEIKKYMVDWADQGDYKHKPIIMEGEYVAKEWVCPDGGKEPELDLRKWGVFYSKNNPPTEAEIETARRYVHLQMDRLVKIADNLYQDPRRRPEITNIYYIAAKHLMVERPWCTVSKEMARCEGCGKAVEQDVAKCGCGAIRDWNKARKLRLVTKEEFEEAMADGLVAAITPETRAAQTKAK